MSTSTPPPPPSGEPPHPPRWQREARRLRRSTTDRYLGGVAGGIAQTYDIDPLVVRILFVVALTIGGAGFFLYLALWVLVPPDDGSLPIVKERHHDRGFIIGIVLLAIGVIAASDRIGFNHAPFLFGYFWPLALIGGGIAILVLRANTASPPVPVSGDLAPHDVPMAAAAAPVATDPAAPSAPGTPGAAEEPTQTAWAPPTQWPTTPPTPPAPPAPPFTPPRPPRRRQPHVLGPLTFSALLLFVGGAALLGVSGVMTVDPAVVAAIALMIVGAALVIGAWYGHARGLIALGIVLTVVAGVLASVDVSVRGPIGDRRYDPVAVASVRREYRVGIGDLRVDLTDVQWTPGTHPVRVRVGIGEATVFVPPNVGVIVHGHAGIGDVRLFDHRSSGVDASDDAVINGVLGGPVIRLDARTGIGDVHVVQEVTQ